MLFDWFFLLSSCKIRTWFDDVIDVYDEYGYTCLKIAEFEIMRESGNIVAVILRDSNI